MSNRRYFLLVLLVPLFGLPLLGLVGPLEILVWSVLVVGWLVAFFTWARPAHITRT